MAQHTRNTTSIHWKNLWYKGLLSVFLTAIWLSGQSVLAAQDGKKYKDWTVQCEKVDPAQPEQCFIFQTLSKNDRPMMQMAAGYLNSQPVAIFTLPLGVALRAGVEIKVDAEQSIRIPYDRCDPGGCIAGLPLTATHIASFKKGKKVYITVLDGTGRSVPLEISLSGFTKGFDAVR